MKVLVACPMSDRLHHGPKPGDEPILAFTGTNWLHHILMQDYGLLDIYMFLNDVCERHLKALKWYVWGRNKFSKHKITYDIEDYGRQTDYRSSPHGPRKRVAASLGEKPYEHFAKVRNKVLDKFHSTDADYLVSIDSDVMIHPDAVSAMIQFLEEHPEYGMVGLPVNNSRIRSRRKKTGLLFGTAQYNFGTMKTWDDDDSDKFEVSPVNGFPMGEEFIEVAYTGACCAIRGSMLREHNIQYGAHRQGEDCHFCWEIKKAGFKIGVLLNHVTWHWQDPFVYPLDKERFNNREII